LTPFPARSLPRSKSVASGAADAGRWAEKSMPASKFLEATIETTTRLGNSYL
jgi:hypothetical protein